MPVSTYLFETEDDAALCAQAPKFAERAIAPHAHTWEEYEQAAAQAE
jgi:hypothetical protein